MPRKHHSPSAVTLGALCERKWAYEKIAHVKSKEYTWAELELLWPGLGPMQRRDLAGARSRALGVAGHAVLESWYRGAQPAWETVPGGLALQGAHHLPGPSACVWAHPEGYIGTTPYEYSYMRDGQRVKEKATVIVLDGIRFLGKKDLRALPTPEESHRLGVASGVATTFDYKFVGSFAEKTTRSGDRYCSVKTPAELQTDAAACVYALDDMRETGLAVAPMRWVYFRTKDAPAAKAVDFVITRAQAEDRAADLVKVARRLDLITSVDDATPNTDACEAFGGCPHSPARGGACTARKVSSAYADTVPHDPYGENIMTAPAMTKEALEAKIASGEALSPLEQRVYALMAGVPAGAPAAPPPAGANGPAPVVPPAPAQAIMAAALNTPVASLPGAPAGLPTPAPAPIAVAGPAEQNTPPAEPTKPKKAKAAPVPLADTLPKVDAAPGISVTVTITGGLAEVARILAAAAGAP